LRRRGNNPTFDAALNPEFTKLGRGTSPRNWNIAKNWNLAKNLNLAKQA
jgi:hypothetical protein